VHRRLRVVGESFDVDQASCAAENYGEAPLVEHIMIKSLASLVRSAVLSSDANKPPVAAGRTKSLAPLNGLSGAPPSSSSSTVRPVRVGAPPSFDVLAKLPPELRLKVAQGLPWQDNDSVVRSFNGDKEAARHNPFSAPAEPISEVAVPFAEVGATKRATGLQMTAVTQQAEVNFRSDQSHAQNLKNLAGN
jgi:hypothetical protein